MKLILVMIAAVVLLGCGKGVLTKEESAEVIAAAIRKAAGKPEGELTKADLEKVTALDLAVNQLTDVTGLEKLTQLKELVLISSKLTEVPKGLENLTQLKKLYLQDNQLTDVKGLENLTQLMFLRLDGNQLTDVKGLEKLTQLEELILYGNQLTDVKGLEKLTQLKDLRIDYNPDLTKAQIEELAKALPKCQIASDHGWFNYRHQRRPRHQGRSGGHSEEEEEEE